MQCRWGSRAGARVAAAGVLSVAGIPWVVAALVVAPACRAGTALEEAETDWVQQALAYEHGEGVVKDPVKAFVLYCEAARAGAPEAALRLGWMYANGRGVPRDDATAAHLLLRAAAGGASLPPALLERLGAPATEMPTCLVELPTITQARSAPPAEAAVPSPPDPVPPPRIAALVYQLAPQFNVDPRLALLIIQLESNFDARAVSPKNARGLMQLIPETAVRFGVRDPFDPRENVKGGLAYLRWLLAYFEGDLHLVTAAYNAGEGSVDRHLGVPPFPETQRYVKRIVEQFGRTRHAFEPTAAPRSQRLHLMQRRAIR